MDFEIFTIDCAKGDGCLCRENFDKQIAAELDPLREEYKSSGRFPKVGGFIIDMSKITCCDNYGCLGIILLSELIADKFGSALRFMFPPNGDFLRDFTSGGFYQLLADYFYSTGANCDLAYSEPNPSRRFVNCRIETRADLRHFIFRAISVHRDFLSQNKNDIQGLHVKSAHERINPCLTISMELAQNIIEHSQFGTNRKPSGYTSLLFTPNQVEIAAMDLGIGIPQSLGYRATDPNESYLAIIEACKYQVSGKKDKGGLGLFFTHKDVKKLGGDMSIRSGRATVLFTSSNQYRGEFIKGYETPFFLGTQIQLTLPLNKSREEIDNGFEVLDF